MKKEDFTLRSLKINGGIVTVDYTEKLTLSGTVQEVEKSEKRLRTPHPDLTRAFQMLNVFVVQSTHLDALDVTRGFIEGSEQGKDAKVFLAQMIKNQQEILDSVDIRGLHVKGSNEKRAVIITSVVSVKGLAFSLNTPRISLSRSTFGFEVGLDESIDEISDEVFAYLFSGKESQQQLNFEDQEEGEGDDETND